MQRSTDQLVTPILLNGAALALLLATFVSSGFLSGLWENPPHSFGVPPVPPDEGSGVSADEPPTNEVAQGAVDADPGALSPAAVGSGAPDDVPPPTDGEVDPTATDTPDQTAPGLAPDPLAELAPTPALDEVAVPDSPQEPAAQVVPPSPPIEPAPEGQCAFRANDIEMGRSIRRRRVARVEQPFVSDGQPVFAWADLHNRDEAITLSRLRFTHVATGHSMESEIEMRVGNHWQVIVEQRLPATLLGQWRIDVVDPSDCVVMSRHFDMTAIGWELED